MLYIESPSAKSIDRLTIELVFSQIALIEAERLDGVGTVGSSKIFETTFEVLEPVLVMVTVYVPAERPEMDCAVAEVFQA